MIKHQRWMSTTTFDKMHGLSLETVWRTDRWHHCFFASMFGIVETNTLLAFNYFRTSRQKAEHSSFTGKLALQLIRNSWLKTLPCSQAQSTFQEEQIALSQGNHILISSGIVLGAGCRGKIQWLQNVSVRGPSSVAIQNPKP